MYAELVGNYKKYEIKNLYDNIIVEHQGTGKYAVNGDGTKGYWVYVEQTYTNLLGPIPGLTGAKHYPTYEEAEETKMYLISKGVPSNKIHITQGQHANPFLTDALHRDTDSIKQIIINYIKEK